MVADHELPVNRTQFALAVAVAPQTWLSLTVAGVKQISSVHPVTAPGPGLAMTHSPWKPPPQSLTTRQVAVGGAALAAPGSPMVATTTVMAMRAARTPKRRMASPQCGPRWCLKLRSPPVTRTAATASTQAARLKVLKAEDRLTRYAAFWLRAIVSAAVVEPVEVDELHG